MREKLWTLKKPYKDIDSISRELNVNPVIAQIMLNRGIRTLEAAQKYLNPTLSTLHDVNTMKDVVKAYHIILDCIKNGEKITVYGDYDADGVTSTITLLKGLKALGANACYYIPHRKYEGYGLNLNIIDDLAENGTKLLLTCDNGISSINEVQKTRDNGIKVIIIDHHEPPYVEIKDDVTHETHIKYNIPNANAVINPKQEDCTFPFKEMCAAGISYRFIIGFFEFLKSLSDEFINLDYLNANYEDLHDEFLILSSIGTFCDVVTLQDDNRVIAKNGLKLMNTGKIKNLGLNALIEKKGLVGKILTDYHIGFIIGPCINASGRLMTAALSVELLLCTDETEASNLADSLISVNDKRIALTNIAAENIIEEIALSSYANDKVYVIFNEDLHESIAGIVAGRVKETAYKPTFVLTKSGDDVKASGRSIPGYNMFLELSRCKELFLRFGGHPMAAGLSMVPENVELLRETLNKNCTLTQEDFKEKIPIDFNLPISKATFDLHKTLNVLAPHGTGNKAPVFGTRDLLVTSLRLIEHKNTLILEFLIPETNRHIKAISFGRTNEFIDGISEFFKAELVEKIKAGVIRSVNIYMDILYSIDLNEYNNTVSIQLKIKEFRISNKTTLST